MASTPAQLTAYLAQQGITLLSPQASPVNPTVACTACSCPTGVILLGAVAPTEVAAVQALGFLNK